MTGSTLQVRICKPMRGTGAPDRTHFLHPHRSTTFAFVKPALNLLLAAFMALNLTWGHDWVHVPGLLKHYQEHKAEHSDLGFLDFLAMHYADAEHRDSDGSHEDLPFNHDHKDHLGVDHVYWTPVFVAERFHLPALEARAFTLADDPLDGYCAHALQPPRQA